MLLPFGSCASLSSLLVLLAISVIVRSQAPGDASSQCVQEDVPEYVIRLLDSNWYEALLSGQSESAGWTQMPADSWSEAGNVCAKRLKSCNSSTVDWLVTQYIDKSADVSYDLEITMEILGNTESCIGCNSNDIEIHYYPSNGAIDSGQQLVPSNYIHIGSLSFSGAAGTEPITFSLGSQFDRFYIAIVAEDICFILRRLRVSYNLCLAKTKDLVIFPNTPIGSDAVTTSASCGNNATVSSGSSLDVTCNTDGTYSGSPNCLCVGGYFHSSNSECSVCPAGEFSRPGATSCTPCPENSHSMMEGAAQCPCDDGYTRVGSDVTTACVDADSTVSGGGGKIAGSLRLVAIAVLLMAVFLVTG